MSEQTTIKSFIVKKTCVGDVFMMVSPMSNPTISRTIRLTDKVPQQVLPLDWALGLIMDQGNETMYRKGYITFDDNDALAKAAVEAGVWFDSYDFKPAQPNQAQNILTILKTGNRSNIQKAIAEYGADRVKEVASYYVDDLTTAVVSMLENLLNVQLIID